MTIYKEPYVECGEGWRDIYTPLIELCAALGVEVTQIKEKFGGLRFYVRGYRPYLDKVIQWAEAESYRTCEECGRPGQLRQDSWMKTLCDEHHNKET